MSQTYAPGDTITGEFPISSATGAAVNADSTPTLLLYQNGTVTGVSVTSANPSTGRYTWSAVIPGGYSARDEIRIEASATVGGIALPATTIFRCRLDASVSSRSSHSADDVWAVGSRTLTAISDSSGVTTLLARLTSTRAIYLDALQYVTDARLTWLERLGSGLEETSTGSGIWRWTTLALSRLGVDVTAIRGKTDALPADPASNTQVNTRMASFAYTAPDNAGIANAAASAATAAAQATTAATQSTTAATQSTTAATQATNAAASAASADGKLTTGRLANIDAATPTRLGILDRLASMMEQVSGLWRWTTNTLSQAPTGSGGGGSAGTQLIAMPTMLIMEGQGTSGKLSLNRGTQLNLRCQLADAARQPISTTDTTLSASITTQAGAPLLDSLTVTPVLAETGLVDVFVDTSAPEVANDRFLRLVIVRDNGESDVTSYPGTIELV